VKCAISEALLAQVWVNWLISLTAPILRQDTTIDKVKGRILVLYFLIEPIKDKSVAFPCSYWPQSSSKMRTVSTEPPFS